QRLVQQPLVVSIEQQCTDEAPCKDIYAYASQLEQEDGVLSVGIALGFPYADVQEMGTSVLVVADGNAMHASRVASRMADQINHMHRDFVGVKIDVSQTMKMLPTLQKPVLLLDMGDNIGG